MYILYITKNDVLFQSLHREYDAEREQLQKMQKKKMEELERVQDDERRALIKNIQAIQEKEYKEFKVTIISLRCSLDKINLVVNATRGDEATQI